MSLIKFKATPYVIKGWTILRLPPEASIQLPSRGIVMVKGTINDCSFQTVLEPDGWKSHWIHLDDQLLESANIVSGMPVVVEMEPTKEWMEPPVPVDIINGIKSDSTAYQTWEKITPMAHWEWIRWIRATNRTETRSKRIDVARSKLSSGMRRPCCFNASACTVPEVSKNGALLEPDAVTAS